MKSSRCLLFVFSTLAIVSSAAAAQNGGMPNLLLQTIRLKPGESKRIELAMPYENSPIRPSGKSGRDSLYVNVLLNLVDTATTKGEPAKSDTYGVFQLSNGVDIIWSKDRPEVEFRAGDNAKPAATNLRIRYESFGGGNFVSGFRVVVEPK